MTDKYIQLPSSLTGPFAWIGRDLATAPDQWLTSFTEKEVWELENAASYFIDTELDISEISKEYFPLSTLRKKFDQIKLDLIHGRGFEVVRGLPVQTYSLKKSAIIFCGIGCYLGNMRSQNARGHILGHVRDEGADAKDPNARIYQTSERQTFHTDSSDVVGLLCLKEAKEGGDSLLVSIATIYNEMYKRRPDLTALLFEPIATDRRGEIPEGEKPYFEIPVLSWHAGYLSGMYQRQYIESAQRFADVPRLTAKHLEALDLFDGLANNPELNLQMRLKPGDIQFVHNHSLLHDRTGFIDWPDLEQKRHLLRLWLSVDGDRPLPDCFKQRFGSITVGDRGGIITKDTKLTIPL
jgi:hypothetical protein